MFRAFFMVGLLSWLCACVECPRVPGLSARQCESLAALALPPSPPPARGNRVADDERAALFGFELFFDARLSRDGTVRCASCHLPERVFGDGRATSQGLVAVDRNSPSLYGAAWHRWQMWDGRADSLWSQPLLAFENEKEMDFTRLELAHRVKASYRASYEALFGALPALDDGARFPPRGKPGLPQWEAMAEADRTAINLVVANLGKALEAYQRRLAFRAGRFDAAVSGAQTLTSGEQAGLTLFLSRGCGVCHSGPLFSDDDFHAIGLVDTPPRARAQGLVTLAASPFNAAGAFFDGEKEALPAARPQDEGAYRTPTLRNVTRTGPWGHDGRFETVQAAVEAHWALAPHVSEPLTTTELEQLVAFLGALDATDPPLPWNGWPDR
ncbi:MAG: cytochrome-c peroxidase [Archangiaceae bacterium]|nr:cytochrome-c peroxidase [Archangiaceae bacterium]